MKKRLITAVGTAAIGAAVGVGVTLWMQTGHMAGIVIVTSLVGFFFGLLFKFSFV
jgi:hypothetical protein